MSSLNTSPKEPSGALLREDPIFVVGAPRSGTTMFRNLLNRHPSIAICGETHFAGFIYRRRGSFGDLRQLSNRQRLVQEYLALQRFKRMDMDLKALGKTLIEEGVSYPDLFASLLRFYARSHGKRRCGEKTPRHALFTKTLIEWYPRATILHLIRDPRDVVASLMRMPWAPSSVVANARIWSRFNAAALRSQNHPGYLQVRYERLVTDPEGELKRICTFLNEEYSPAMLVPEQNAGPDKAWFQRAKTRVTTQRLEKWREDLTPGDAALVEWFAGPSLEMFGYACALPPPSGVARMQGLGIGLFDAIRRRIGEFPGGWSYWRKSIHLAREEAAKQGYYEKRRRRMDRKGD